MASQSSPPQSVHDFTVNDIKGNDVDLSIYYKGKGPGYCQRRLAVVWRYWHFHAISSAHKSLALDEEIQEFACTRLKAEYPIFDKLDVNGANAASLG